MVVVTASRKLCRDCGRLKSRTEFYVKDRRAKKLFSRCKPCYGAWVHSHRRAAKKPSLSPAGRSLQRKAWRALSNAVFRGKILKPSCCEWCGVPVEKSKLEGHHPDYSKPLSVAWLCNLCHQKIHEVNLAHSG